MTAQPRRSKRGIVLTTRIGTTPIRNMRIGTMRIGMTLIGMTLIGTSACAGGAPLHHPAHVLSPDKVSMGAGVSAQLSLATPTADATDAATPAGSDTALADAAVSPGVAPWVAGRMGLIGSNEAGLTYSGRAVRLDFRHAFEMQKLAFSIGLGGSALIPKREDDESSLYGGGADVPILFGYQSDADIFALWVGPRGGFEIIRGDVVTATTTSDPSSPDPAAGAVALEATHGYVGGLVGIRAGFRHVHAVLEVSAKYHYATGALGGVDTTVQDASITPSSALVVTF